MRKGLVKVASGLLVTGALMAASNAFALGGYGTLAGDDKKVADVIKDNLEISENSAYEIYNTYIKTYINAKDWHYDTYNNSTLKASLSKSADRLLHLNFTTSNRFINLSFFKFAKENKIILERIETLPRTSETAVEKSNELKKDTSYSLGHEGEAIATFYSKEYSDKVKCLVYSGSGAIQYLDLLFYDLNRQ